MSIYLCKNVSSHLKCFTSCSSFNKLLHFHSHFISSFTTNSSTNSSVKDSFTVSYLINSCGLSSENALLASKNVKLKSHEKADLVVALFKKHGFSNTQIENVVKKLPCVLLSDSEKTITPKLEYFSSRGVSRTELAKLVSASPCVLRISLEKKIIPTWNLFESLLISSERTFAATIRFFNSRWASNLEARVVPNVKILRDFGVQESNIVSLLTSQPSVLMIASDRFRMNVERVKEMGFSPQKFKFVFAVCALTGMSKSTWERKVEICKKWGWSEEDVYVAFEKHPWCMMVSEDKMSSIMDMVINKAGFEPSDIVQRPKSLTCSLEKRIIPRCLVYQDLLERGLIMKKWSLRILLEVPEKQFLNKITMCSNEAAPDLLKLYKEKLELKM
ncbi:uncharacterized protein LOC141677244 isoform X1 [Apium graveolens]|uniref:uncharacterized protein LOC141677244 isoform X1 n=1 Tax=Apium graveolens TaxID=4045 RepID=UPI003D7A8D88